MPETADFKLDSDDDDEPQEGAEPGADASEPEEPQGDSATIDAERELDEFLETKQKVLAPIAEKPRDQLRVVEAALFLGNRTMTFPELAVIAKTSVRGAKSLCEKLAAEYAARECAVEVFVDAKQATLQVKPTYLTDVSSLSKNVELSRKSMRMLGLIAKKGKLFQSELKKYFRGDIYGYITELKDLGYITSDKAGNTRLLRATSKFYETFQWSAPVAPQEPSVVQPAPADRPAGENSNDSG